jgi:uncharacterized protein (TIGR00288 family)
MEWSCRSVGWLSSGEEYSESRNTSSRERNPHDRTEKFSGIAAGGGSGGSSGGKSSRALITDGGRDDSTAAQSGTTRGGPHPPGSVPQGVALFVDGPNVFREEFDVDLNHLRQVAADAGPLIAARLYLDEHAPPGLIQAAEARGFQVVTTSGDVDVRLAVDLARFAAEGRAATIAVASRDTDFKPAVEAANEYGLATMAIAPGSYGRSDALRNAVDRGVTLDELVPDDGDETDGDETDSAENGDGEEDSSEDGDDTENETDGDDET